MANIAKVVMLGKKDIYLNDNLPSNPKFDTMWMETKEIYDPTIRRSDLDKAKKI